MTPRLSKDLLLASVAAAGLMAAAPAAADPLVITAFDATQPAANLVAALQAANSGISIVSSSFIGITGQSGTYTGFNLPANNDTQPTISAPNGVLLTNGSAALPLTNTTTAFSHTTNTGSNDQLTALVTPNTTNDQNVLTVTFTANSSAANAVSADFVYGTDEYPEYAAKFTDTFGFFVDGKNYAVFPDGSLVSITTATLGNFNDNNTKNANGATAYGLEYDGISNLLTVNGSLDPSLTTHTLTIAIADIDDSAVDSGVFIGNLRSNVISGGGGIITSAPVIDTTNGDIAANVFSLGSAAAQASTVTFAGGTLRETGGAFAGNVITAPVTITNANGTVDTGPASGGFSGVVSGPGALTVTGTNTFSLTGANTYTGGTLLQGGTLLVGSDTALGAGPLAMFDGTTLREDVGVTLANAVSLSGTGTIHTSDTTGDGDGLILNGVVSGDGTLAKTGASGLRLAGVNTYTGGTVLSEGHIGIASNAALGTGTLTFAGGFLRAHADGFTVSNAAVLQSDGRIDTQQFGLTFAGAISGPGQLSKTGTGTLLLTGVNTYAGGTLIRAGTLAVNNAGAIGAGTLTFGMSTSGKTGTFQAAADGLGFANAVAMTNDGTVDTQGFGLTLTGVISGSGHLTKTGTGTLDLSVSPDFSTYSGGTTIAAGTVQIQTSHFTAGTFDGGSVGTGTITLDGGTLKTVPADPFFNLPNPIHIGPNGGTILSNGANVVTFGGITSDAGALPLTLTSGRTTLAANVLDFAIFGAGSSTAGTRIAAGTIVALASDDALGTGSLDVAGGAQLDLGPAKLRVTTLTGAGDIFTSGIFGVQNGITTTTALGVDAGSFAGTLADADTGGPITVNGVTASYAGIFRLFKASDGLLVLTGSSTYSGITQVDAGVLQAGSAAALSSRSAYTVAAGATLALAGFDNTIGSLAGAGTVTNVGATASTLTTGGNNTSTAFGGLVSDGTASLALVKDGTGTMAITGANTYSGGTRVMSGALEIGDSAALGTGPLTLDDGTTLRFTSANLDVGNAIALPGTDPVIDTGSGFQTISGAISGPGALTKLGSGTLDLTGTNTYTGATTVAEGTLRVDGSTAASAATVNGGATIGGGGTIGALALLSGASVAPAAGKTLTVVGNVTFAAGSTYQVTVNGDGSSSKLGVGGTATLGGAGLSVVKGSGAFASTTYTLLSAAGGVSGSFGAVTTDLAFLSPTVGYTPTDVTLTLSASRLFSSVAATPNQAATASAIQALGPGSPLYNAVLSLDPAGARQAFAAASGVTHAEPATITASTNRLMTGLLLDRLWDVSGSGLSARQVLDQFAPDGLPALVRCYGPVPDPVPAPAPRTYTAWGEAFGSFGHSDATANAGGLDRTLGGFVLGIDTPIDGSPWRAGVAGGYTNTSFRSPLDGGDGTVQGVFGSLYGGARYGAVDVRLGTTVGGTFTDARRTVAFPGFFEAERSSNNGLMVQGFGELGYRFTSGNTVVEPIAGASILHFHQDGFTETGGAAALTVAGKDTDLGVTTVGVRGEVAPLKGVPLVAHGLLAWQHTIGDVSPASLIAFAANPSQTFSITGAPIDRDALAAEAALDYRTSAAMDIGLTYSGVIGPTAADHSVKGRLEYRF